MGTHLQDFDAQIGDSRQERTPFLAPLGPSLSPEARGGGPLAAAVRTEGVLVPHSLPRLTSPDCRIMNMTALLANSGRVHQARSATHLSRVW